MMHQKVALITGGCSGIGKAVALKFASQGIAVGILDNKIDSGDNVAEQINRQNGNAWFVQCDVSIESELQKSIDAVVEHFGRLDYAYNNAGIGGDFAPVETYPTDNWDKVMSVNLRGVFLSMKYEIPHLLKQEKSAIVNCCSLLSTVAYENDSAYVASKFGVLGLTKNAALEYAKTGLRINAISPGFTDTPMVNNGDTNKLSQLAAKHPIGRLATAEEIAEGVVWLCSDNSSFAIGLNLVLDGGYTII